MYVSHSIFLHLPLWVDWGKNGQVEHGGLRTAIRVNNVQTVGAGGGKENPDN